VSKQRHNVSPEEVRRLVGDPKTVEAELEDFGRSVQLLSSNLVDEYGEQWVAIHKGSVQANSRTLDGLLCAIDEKRLPRARTIIRFIETKPRRLML